jgi:glycosyltransferase involved in cell wall biosynthesis
MTRSTIRVLYLQPAPLFGGAERQASEQALFLPAFGVDMTLIAGPGEAIESWVFKARDVRFTRSQNFPAWSPQRGLQALTLPWRYVMCGIRARDEFARAVASEQIDVIVASLPFAWIVGTLVARRAGIPIVWRAGGSRLPWFMKVGVWLLSRFLRPDLLLCNGKAVHDLFHPLIGGPVAVLRNGVDPKLFGPSAGDPRRYRPDGARRVVGFAGRLAPSKHVEDVIALARSVRERHPDVRLLVAGDGSERLVLEERARSAGADNLTFLGFVDDMASFYAACDIIVLPSESEGHSNVLLEAMRSKKAIVATNIDPVLEMIDDGETGLVFPLGDSDALVRVVDRLLYDSELLTRLGRNAAERVNGLTAYAAARRLAAIVRDVAAGRHLIPEPAPQPATQAAQNFQSAVATARCPESFIRNVGARTERSD